MTTPTCPICGHIGRSVDTATLKALLNVSLRRLRATSYYFCTSACDVAYFAQDGSQTFNKMEVRVPIYQKEAADSTSCATASATRWPTCGATARR